MIRFDASLLKIKILNNKNDYAISLTEINELQKKHPYHYNVFNTGIATFKQFNEFKIKTISENKESFEDLLSLATYLISHNETTKAIEYLQKIPQNNIDIYEKAQRLIARAYFECSRFDLADQIFLRVIKQTKNQTTIKECYYWMGLSQLLLCNYEDAIQSFETIETYDRNYLNTQPILDNLRKSKFLNHNGFIVLGSNLDETNLKLTIKKNHFGPQKQKKHQFEVIGFAQSYNDEGCKQLIKHQFKAAKESFHLAIQMDPKFYISYINIALLNIIENSIDEGLEQISQAESITTNCPYLFFTKAMCYKKKNDFEQSIRYIQQAIKLHPKELIFHIILGNLFEKNQQVELSNTYWSKGKQSYEYQHLVQEKYRYQHFDKISLDYWISPESLCQT
mgnify:CR=1 FL=1